MRIFKVVISMALFLMAHAAFARRQSTTSSSAVGYLSIWDNPRILNSGSLMGEDTPFYIYPSISGSYSHFVIEMCPQGSSWSTRSQSVVYGSSKTPTLIANPTCIQVAQGSPSELQWEYYQPNVDVAALYGLYQMGYTIYLEADVASNTGTSRVLLASFYFIMLAPQ